MKRLKVSNNVIRRLPRYLRKLDELTEIGISRISSFELGHQLGLTPSQIRQDFSCFGEFGQQGYGYNVPALRAQIASILGMDRGFTAVLVGVGNIGHALMDNFCFAEWGFNLAAAFDIKPEIIGTTFNGVPIHAMDELEDYLAANHVDVAVLTVPKEAAIAVTKRLTDNGIDAIWNFTNLELTEPNSSTIVENIHFSDSLLEKMTGNRVNYAMVTVGGARRDIDDELRCELLEACDKLKAPLDRITEIALTDKTIAMRTKGVGVLPKEDALRMGAVGPHARASGVKVDVRKDAPYSSYEDFDFDVPVVESGDVFARVVVRALECYESIKIIRQALENLPATPINLGNKLIKIQPGQAVCRHEAPRGQLSHMVVGDGSFNNHRVSIHVPSYKNTPTVPFMLRGNTVADAGLIIASIDPCFSCLDR